MHTREIYGSGSQRRRLAFAVSFGCALVAGCGGGTDDGTTGPAPQIALTLTSAGATATPGQSITFGVTITGSNGFTGPAAITVTGAPPGVTASASAAQVTGSTTTSTVSVSVGTAVSAGTYPLSVTGSGSGVESVTRPFALTVAAQPGGFTIATSVPTVTLAQGSSITNTITIARTGAFAGTVSFAATGMSNGLSAVFTPASAIGSSTTLTLTANSVAVTGTTTLTITGSAASLPPQTVTTQVTVTPAAGGGAGSVTVDFSGCGEESKPIWFARQDGGGPWARVSSTNDIYTFTINGNAGGYAFATRPEPNTSAVSVKLSSRGELTNAPITVCTTPRGNKTVMATVTGVGSNQQAVVNLGGSSVSVPASATVALPNISNGTFDLVAWRMNGARNLNTASDSKGVIIRDVNVPDGASAGTVNFDAEAGVPVVWDVAFTGGNPGDTFSGSMTYYTGPRESCTGALLYNFSNTVPSVPVGAWGFPAATQRPTDFYVLRAVASNSGATRVVQRSFHLAGASALNLGASVATPVVTDISDGGYKRLQVSGSTPIEYSATIVFRYANNAGDKSAMIEASVGWLGGNVGALSFPDFSGVSGWENSWVPPATSPVQWTFGGTAKSFFGAPCVEDALFRAAYVGGEK